VEELPDGYEPEEARPPRRRRWIAAIMALLLALVIGSPSILNFLEITDGESEAPAYDFLLFDPDSQSPVRYDPCRPLRYVINRESAPPGAVQDVHEAVDRMADASGITFDFAGYTTEHAVERRAIFQPARYGRARWAPLLIGWVPQDRLPRKGRHPVGAGGSAYEPNGAGRWVFVSGIVAISKDADLESGFGLGATWGDVLLHELGHVLGLDHVDDAGQIMYESLTAGEAALGSGDLAGLRRVGRAAGCLDSPSPLQLLVSFGRIYHGDRLSLQVYRLRLKDEDCKTGAFRYLGIGALRAAYHFDCRSWESVHPSNFFVSLGNKLNRSVGFRLGNFTLVTRDRRYFKPVDLRSQAEFPNRWVPLGGTIDAVGFVRGYIGFVLPKGAVPRFLTYSDSDEALTVSFDGRLHLIP
jgi:hypothetical protein